MSGKLGQLTTSELTTASDAAEELYKLGEYLDRMTYMRVVTLRADLQVEREDRERGRASATAEAKTGMGVSA